MSPNDPNVVMLDIVAQRLGEAMRQQLVFVGDAIAGLLITDPSQPAIRPTEDVDLLAQVVARADYYALEQALRARGFAPDLRAGAPICRWTVDRVTVDVMPTLPDVLGFSNRWYPEAAATLWLATLPSGRKVQVIAPAAFIATKLEAFAGRGGGDYLFSHDLGDVISVVDGREGLVDEVAAATPAKTAYIAATVSDLLKVRGFLDSLPGHLPGDSASQARLMDLIQKLRAIAAIQRADA